MGREAHHGLSHSTSAIVNNPLECELFIMKQKKPRAAAQGFFKLATLQLKSGQMTRGSRQMLWPEAHRHEFRRMVAKGVRSFIAAAQGCFARAPEARGITNL